MKHLIILSVLLFVGLGAESKTVKERFNKIPKDVINLGKNTSQKLLMGIKGKLSEAMAKDLVGSIEYCHENAIPLAQDFIKGEPQVIEIKRTSLKVRNPKNKPDAQEEEILNAWNKLASEGKKLPEFEARQVSAEEIRYYKPLKVESMCLTCHGSPSGELLKAISTKYPDDKATGYKENDFRGVLRISIRPQKVTPAK